MQLGRSPQGVNSCRRATHLLFMAFVQVGLQIGCAMLWCSVAFSVLTSCRVVDCFFPIDLAAVSDDVTV